MSEHTAVVAWQRADGEPFVNSRYSRRHSVTFDGGATLPLSSSPHVVPAPYSDASAADPEELFLAALSSCHMLWFLSFAAKAGYVVDSYRDSASAILGPNSAGQETITLVILRPHCQFSGANLPGPGEFAELHSRAHHACYLANSVNSEVRIEPVF